MSVRVTGTDEDGNDLVFTMGEPLPEDYAATWDLAIAQKRTVGLPWWQQVPSYTEPAGFVAAAIASLYEVTAVQGFSVPVRPDDQLPL